MALALAVAVLLALLLRGARTLSTTRGQLLVKLQAEQQTAEESAAEVQRLTSQVQDLVRGRLPPPLRPLLVDDLIELEPAPLRSIFFTRVGTPDRPTYEYRLNCLNTGPGRCEPRLRLLVFNDVGIQIGSANPGGGDDTTRVGAAGMAVGESVSFSGNIALEFDAPPSYFVVINLPADGQLPHLPR